MVVIPTSRDEGRLGPIALHQFKAEHAAVEGQRPLKVGNFQVNVPDLCARVDGSFGLALVHYGLQYVRGHHDLLTRRSSPTIFISAALSRS